MSCRRLLMAGLGCAVLAGCNTVNKNIGTEDPFLGEAVKYNAAVQIINPEPVYAEGAAEPGSSGVIGAQAVKRYRKDEVRPRHRQEARAASQGAISTTEGPQ